ncbi:MAG: family 20 glycosylhydrolase [Bacteroidota bacterium]
MRYLPLVAIAFSLLQITCESASKSNQTSSIFPSRVTWQVISNVAKEEPSCLAAFTFYNDSDQVISGDNWELYYNQTNRRILNNPSSSAKVEQIVGDFYRLTPNETFEILPNDSLTVEYECTAWLIKETDAPHGLHWNVKQTDGSEKQMAVENYEVLPFESEAQVSRHKNDKTPMVTAAWQYEENEYLSVLPEEELQLIIPKPKKIEKKNGQLTINSSFVIQHSEDLEKEANYLKDKLKELIDLEVGLTTNSDNPSRTIFLQQGDAASNQAEDYELEIKVNDGIRIFGKEAAGIFYGIQSLLSLLPTSAILENPNNILLPEIKIEDAPRFPYRGMHLDVARNFQEVAAVKKLIDVMAFYKMNKLHLHLTEDEGWRLEIDGLPELTEVGSRRGHTLDSRDHLPPSYGSGFDPDDEKSHGNGYYTKAQFIDILKYANDRHIEVIPEINVPGHARAAIKAMEARYRKYMAEGDTTKAEQYLLSDLEDESEYFSVQDFPDNVVCICRESVYEFYEKVVDEVAKMYEEAEVPLTTLHTGGDEVPNGVWEKSPICTDLMDQIPELSTPVDLKTYFMGRISNILAERNLVVAGWEEIAMEKVMKADSSFTYIAHPDFTKSNFLPYVWQNLWGNQDLGYRLANAGYPVILCNVTNFYFDLAYSKDPKEPGFYWGGFIDTRKPYETIPYDIFKSTTHDPMGNEFDQAKDYAQLERLKKSAESNILGIQGELWSETVKGGEMLEYYYLPKLIGLAERAWAAQPDWATMENQTEREAAIDQAWNVVANTIAQQELPKLSKLSGGYNYRIPPPGAIVKDGMLEVNSSLPGLMIRYTTDGSEPTVDSKIYEQAIEAKGIIHLKAFDLTGKGSRVVIVEDLE